MRRLLIFIKHALNLDIMQKPSASPAYQRRCGDIYRVIWSRNNDDRGAWHCGRDDLPALVEMEKDWAVSCLCFLLILNFWTSGFHSDTEIFREYSNYIIALPFQHTAPISKFTILLQHLALLCLGHQIICQSTILPEYSTGLVLESTTEPLYNPTTRRPV